ncbi:MAG TPA: hypothetical protein VF828_02150 [Patescibacteria group bacterium]
MTIYNQELDYDKGIIGKEIRRLWDFVTFRRGFERVKNFQRRMGISGGEELKKDYGLTFVPEGRVEVIYTRKDHQTYFRIDEERLRRR